MKSSNYTQWVVKVGSREHIFSKECLARQFYKSLSDLKLTKTYLLKRETFQELLEENEIVCTLS